MRAGKRAAAAVGDVVEADAEDGDEAWGAGAGVVGVQAGEAAGVGGLLAGVGGRSQEVAGGPVDSHGWRLSTATLSSDGHA